MSLTQHYLKLHLLLWVLKIHRKATKDYPLQNRLAFVQMEPVGWQGNIMQLSISLKAWWMSCYLQYPLYLSLFSLRLSRRWRQFEIHLRFWDHNDLNMGFHKKFSVAFKNLYKNYNKAWTVWGFFKCPSSFSYPDHKKVS